MKIRVFIYINFVILFSHTTTDHFICLPEGSMICFLSPFSKRTFQ